MGLQNKRTNRHRAARCFTYQSHCLIIRLLGGSKMNCEKIAFIICINDEQEYAECKYYLDKLILPEGFIKDIITIQDAPCMAAGYNAGLQNTDAKYKVYMHQDVFIIHKNFIADLINVFQNHTEIGIIGCIGSTQIGADAIAVSSWDTGSIYHNCTPMYLHFPCSIMDQPTKVEALDGLLLATQYDIPWREDLMDGWDFYDISQCKEFQLRGLSAAVPYQHTPWCYHDNQYSKMKKYHFYRQKFLNEYYPDNNHTAVLGWETGKEYEQLKESSRKAIESLIRSENRSELQKIFNQPDNRGYLHLREYELIAQIDKLEQEHHSSKRMWETGMDLTTLLHKLRYLKFQLKRLEYLTEHPKTIIDRISSYSIYAQTTVCEKYIYHPEKVLYELSAR